MKCLYCGSPLALLRQLSDGTFCSEEHREAFVKKSGEPLRVAPHKNGNGVHHRAESAMPDPGSGPEPDRCSFVVDPPGPAELIYGVLESDGDPMPLHPPAILPGTSPLPAEQLAAAQLTPGAAPVTPSAPSPRLSAGPGAVDLDPETQEGVVLVQPEWSSTPQLVPTAPVYPSHVCSSGSTGELLASRLQIASGMTLASLAQPVRNAGYWPKVVVAMPFLREVSLEPLREHLRVTEWELAEAERGSKNLCDKIRTARRFGLAVEEEMPPGWGQMLPVKSIAPAIGVYNTRHARMRGSFFAARRVADVSTMAGQMVRQRAGWWRIVGTDSWDWLPNLIEWKPKIEVHEVKLERALQSYEEQVPEPSEVTFRPRFHFSGNAFFDLSSSGRLSMDSILPPLESAISPWALEPQSVPMADESYAIWPSANLPISGRAALEASLVRRQPPVAIAGSLGHRPVPSEIERFEEIPSRIPTSAGSQLSGGLRKRSGLTAMAAPAAVWPDAFGSLPSNEPSPMGEVTETQPMMPQLPPVRRAGPACNHQLYRLQVPDLPIGIGTSVVDRQELTHLEPNPLKLIPRLKTRVQEDTEYYEAVRRYKTQTESSSKFRFPVLAIPSLGRLKWALLTVPLALGIGFYTLSRAPRLGASPPEVLAAQQNPPPAVEPPATPAPQPEPEPPPSPVAAKPARKAPPVEVPVEIVKAATPAPTPVVSQPSDGFIDTLKKNILRRAAIALSDDFRAGLADWQGSGDWSRQWAYDAAGFLSTGPSVVLYVPSMTLSDYSMEFMGLIESRSLGWVFRAQDHRNYHAAKITLVRSGPLPQAVVQHYTVTNGREGVVTRRPLPIQIRMDTLYRVRMDVSGENFTLSVQGQVVDHWSDNRLPSGGVGFFSSRGEQARLRWIEVSHQSDALGRLCAFLAPYSMPAGEGNQKQ